MAHCNFAPAENFLLSERVSFFQSALRHFDRAPNAAARAKDRAALLRETEDCELQVLLDKELRAKVDSYGLEKWANICGLNTIYSTELHEKARELSTTLFTREQLLSEFARPFRLFEAQIEFDCRFANKQHEFVDAYLIELVELCAERDTKRWPDNWKVAMVKTAALPGFDPRSLDWPKLVSRIELANHRHQIFSTVLTHLDAVINGTGVQGLNDSEDKENGDNYEDDNREKRIQTQPEQQSYFIREQDNYNGNNRLGVEGEIADDKDHITNFVNSARIRSQTGDQSAIAVSAPPAPSLK